MDNAGESAVDTLPINGESADVGAMTKPSPLVIIVGFLGAGKSTLLRDLLPELETRGLSPFVIINDYQNARIDAASLRSSSRTVAAINGNCICCDSVMELMVTLLEIPESENRIVLVEANGTTDPTQLIEHLLVNPLLRERFAPLIQIAVVDAKRWQTRHWHNELERLQVETASHVVFTRLDSETSARVVDVRSEVGCLNSKAAQIDLAALTNFLATCSGVPPNEWHEHSNDEAHTRHKLSHAFVGVELALPEAISSTTLGEWLSVLPADVLRVKGLVQLSDANNEWFTFQRVDASSSGTEIMRLLQVPTIPSCAVLVGVKLDAAFLSRQLRDVLQKAGG